MSTNKYTKEQIPIRLGVLKTRMYLRRQLISAEVKIIRIFQKSIEQNKKEFLDYKREYVKLLEEYYELE